MKLKDTRNFIFNKSCSVIIKIEGIQSTSILPEGSVMVLGTMENKIHRSVDFTTAVYDNSEKFSHEVYHTQPT